MSEREGKCIFCQFHELVGNRQFSCKNPDSVVTTKEVYRPEGNPARRIPDMLETITSCGCDYPERFLP